MSTAAAISTVDTFLHVRVLLGMVISLALARLLNGIVRIVQHPHDVKLYPVHLAWVLVQLLQLPLWWWWEIRLMDVQQWTFWIFAFVVAYAMTQFLITAMLFPDSMRGYETYADYYFDRRRWLLGFITLSFLLDLGDTWLKLPAGVGLFTDRQSIGVALIALLCMVGGMTRSRLYHALLVAVVLLHQISLFAYYTRLVDVPGVH
ncbi:hypothetical protein FVQ98_07070 [Ottowia sp. GY511]|uniref:Uncharacterized protein n=1 Tax=Ottowia flava TaxID=2675430 RepID=A0ABW4KV06_9BURK|nr:hypothetical protein [Ottowia sp. GY511]TXK31041.1 hypothetical protein FVQ98_07070 [Ottowia sp. GY511]